MLAHGKADQQSYTIEGKSVLQPLDQQAEQHAEQHGAGERNRPLPAEQPEFEISRQTAQSQAAQQRHEPADAHQRDEDNDEPAQHGLQAMRAVALRKAARLPGLAWADGQHLEQLAHFVLQHQFERKRLFCGR